MQTKNYVKSDHAHKVLDRMLRASRQLLGWPKSPDPSLFR